MIITLPAQQTRSPFTAKSNMLIQYFTPLTLEASLQTHAPH
jgi:hypothetical protein